MHHFQTSMIGEVSRCDRQAHAKDTLLQRLDELVNPEKETDETHRAVLEAVGELQSFHTPAETVLFWKFLLGGTWSLIYSTVLPEEQHPRDDLGAPLVHVSQVMQSLNFTDVVGKGQLVNTIHWDVPSREGVRGVANVICSLDVDIDGALKVFPMNINIRPEGDLQGVDAQEIVQGIGAMAREQFDPTGQWLNIYIDTEIRVLAGMDDRLRDVVVIYKKVGAD